MLLNHSEPSSARVFSGDSKNQLIRITHNVVVKLSEISPYSRVLNKRHAIKGSMVMIFNIAIIII